MKAKVLVALGIFTFLLVVAWWANEISERRYYIDEENNQFIGMTVDSEERHVFGPREYIKRKR